MRSVSAATAAYLANPPAGLLSADLFTFTLRDGATTYRWTSFDRDLLVNGNLYSSRKPWIQRSRWSVSNTMQVPTLEVTLLALNDAFSGGSDIKGQLTNGLFDGASGTLDRIFFVAAPNSSGVIVIAAPVFAPAATAVLQTWQAGPYPANGQVQTGLSFFDSSGAQIGSRQNSDIENPPASWAQHTLSVTVPAGATRIRVFQVFLNNHNDGNTGCIDDISLAVGGVPQTLQNPGAEAGMASWTTSHGVVSSVSLRTDVFGFSMPPRSGSFMFSGRDGPTTDYDEVYQDVFAAPDAVRLFGGNVANIEITGNSATINIKGKVNLLDQNAPRNLYQLGCQNTFCDAGCTLLRATYTTSYTVGSSGIGRTFIPWSSAPATPGRYRYGTVTFTSGACAGQARTVRYADATGLTLIHPLAGTPSAGDGFTAFEGCDKAKSSGSGQDCNSRSNTQNWRAFPYVPPADTAF